jgi:tripartite-type tricarboxylate transporter receptor subunit TctC
MTGINMQHVTYRAAPQALTDLLGGQVQVMFDNLPTSIEHIKAGRLRALGVSSLARSDALPDIPTVGETVAGFETSAFAGIGAPKNTPVEIIDRLNSEVNAGLATTELKAFIAKLGATPLVLSPAEFGDFIARETEKWGKVVKFSGAKPE